MEEKLNLTNEWDKVFPKSDKVNNAGGGFICAEKRTS